MSDRSSISLAALAALAACSLLAAAAAPAQEPAAPEVSAEGAIRYRQNLMHAVGGDMGAISDILKYRLPFPTHIAEHARSLAQSALLIPAAFEPRVIEGPTDAKPAVWERPDEFREKAEAMGREAAVLAEVATNGDPAAIARQTKALGDACGACHDTFRKPKEQSYKRAAGGGHP